MAQAGLLDRLYTDLCTSDWRVRWLDRLVPQLLKRGVIRTVCGRCAPGIANEKIDTFPMYAVMQHLQAKRRGLGPADLYGGYVRGNRRFGELVVRRGLGEADAVYVFNGAGLEILRHARERGMRTIVDQTMAPVSVVERLLDEERERWPGWENVSGGAVIDGRPFWRELADREEAEWQLADQIICGSPYVVDSVGQASGPAVRCAVVPYGYESASSASTRELDDGAVAEQKARPMRVLFVGTIGLRKGVPDLMQAAKLLKNENVEIRAVGPVHISAHAAEQLGKWVELTGAVPRAEVARQYAWADVLVLPTLAEGSANVCYEAMAQGCPVITTSNAGSVVRDEVDGYLVPIRSPELLAERIAAISHDPEKRRAMGRSAQERMADYTWSVYGRRLVQTITTEDNQLSSGDHSEAAVIGEDGEG
ncbi:MAG: glycosyltransferase family 4 protein [Phycisphaeraceae bacterium]